MAPQYILLIDLLSFKPEGNHQEGQMIVLCCKFPKTNGKILGDR